MREPIHHFSHPLELSFEVYPSRYVKVKAPQPCQSNRRGIQAIGDGNRLRMLKKFLLQPAVHLQPSPYRPMMMETAAPDAASIGRSDFVEET